MRASLGAPVPGGRRTRPPPVRPTSRYGHPVSSPDVRVRLASTADVEAVVALVQSAYRGESSRAGWTTEADLLDGQRTDAEQVRGAIDEPGSRVLLALDPEDGLLACCQVQRRDARLAHFGMFAVRPLRQGGGVGGRVLAAAEELARRELGAAQMEMAVIAQRGELIAWYERRGYVRTGGTLPFPHGDPRFGLPRRADLAFCVLAKQL